MDTHVDTITTVSRHTRHADRSAFARRPSTVGPADDETQLNQAITCAQDGGRDAMRYLYCRYADMIYGYVRSILRDEHDAEDVTQTVFTKVMLTIDRYEPRGLPFSHWLLRVARNAALDHVRRRRLVPVAEVRLEDASSEGAEARRTATLKDALASLPGQQRDVVVLRHLVGLSPPEIAHRLRNTEAAIHGLHHRGREALKATLVAQGLQPAVRRIS